MKKIVQVVTLPTDKAVERNQLIIDNDGQLRLAHNNFNSVVPHISGLHLYFTANEELKEGDYFICDSVYKVDNAKHADNLNEIIARGYVRLKVIASTDKKLGVALIPSEYVEYYAANKGNITTASIDTNIPQQYAIVLKEDNLFLTPKETNQKINEANQKMKECVNLLREIRAKGNLSFVDTDASLSLMGINNYKQSITDCMDYILEEIYLHKL